MINANELSVDGGHQKSRTDRDIETWKQYVEAEEKHWKKVREEFIYFVLTNEELKVNL